MGSGANNTARYLGSAVGITVVAVIVTRAGAAPGVLGVVSGWNVAAPVTAGFSLLGALTVLLARQRAAGPKPSPVSGPEGPWRPRRAPRGCESISSKDMEYMTDKKVWFVTGAGRGMGVDIAKAALAAGNAVVATGRNTDMVAKAVGEAEELLVVKLDITSPDDAQAAVRATVDRFGRIDVLVNNAATAQMGYFEEISQADVERQVATNLFGPMNVTRAVLPVMRKQHSGHIVSISSTAGLTGLEFTSAYAASKFGLEGWMESLQPEIAPFGITTTIVEPGFFRTELLEEASVSYGDLSLGDYAERTAQTQAWWQA
jgi:NAD(P)-dependent dehydrogenase (short-subunit alcohol dehydrogenase family)